jgi:hypothetical protein
VEERKAGMVTTLMGKSRPAETRRSAQLRPGAVRKSGLMSGIRAYASPTGRLVLFGSVLSWREKDLVIGLTRRMPGVTGVQDHIRVKAVQ